MGKRTELQAQRRAAGLSQEALAHRVGVSTNSIRGWERGTQTPHRRYRDALAHHLGVTLTQLTRLIDPEAPVSSGDHQVAPWLDHFTSLEQAASELHGVELLVIPALLEIPAYAEAIERFAHPAPTERQVADRVAVRMARSTVLQREPDPLMFEALLPERVLWEAVGDAKVMSSQLDHLQQMARRPNVELRVLPADGRVTSAVSSFELLTRPEQSEPFMARTTDVTGPCYYEDPYLVDRFRTTFEHLRAISLSPSESVHRIGAIREHYR